MKHVFFVQSCITYISAMSIINELDISKSDVMLLCARKFSAEFEPNLRVSYLPEGFNESGFEFLLESNLFSFLTRHKIIHSLDLVINDFIKTQVFTAYLPHTNAEVLELIITHRKCKKLCLFEEGIVYHYYDISKLFSHFSESHKSSISTRIKRWLTYPIYLDRTMAYRSYKTFFPIPIYVLSSTLMNPHPQVSIRILKDTYVSNSPSNVTWENSHIFIVGAEVEANLIDIDDYINVISIFIEKYMNRVHSTLWVKFHPIQKHQDDILRILRHKGIKFAIFPSDLCVEYILLLNINITLYGFISSLLLYGALWGHQSYTLIPILEQTQSAYVTSFKNRPAIFDKLVREFQ